MSKLYLTARTDKKKSITASANKWIDIQLGYDETDYSKKLNIRMNIPSDTGKPTLWYEGIKIAEVTL